MLVLTRFSKIVVIILLFIGSSISLYAQNEIVAAEYFIDVDPGPGKAIAIPLASGSAVDFSHNIEFTGISEGFHTIAIRLKDSNGDWSVIQHKRIFVSGITQDPIMDSPVLPIIYGEYFFNEDPGVFNGTPLLLSQGHSIDFTKTISVSALPEGNHTVFARFMDLSGRWSFIEGESFTIYTPSECMVPDVDFTYTLAPLGEESVFEFSGSNVNESTVFEWDFNLNDNVEELGQSAGFVFTEDGTYDVLLTVSNSEECFASMVKTIQVGALLNNQLTVVGNTSICQGETVELIAPPGDNYIWNTGATGQHLIVGTNGAYTCSYRDENGLYRVSDTVHVTVNELPVNYELIISNAFNGLANGAAQLVSPSSAGYTFEWSNGSSSKAVTGLIPDTYTVQINNEQCSVIESFEIINEEFSPEQLIVAAEYFLNEDPGVGNGISIPVNQGASIDYSFDLITDDLLPGRYQLLVRLKDGLGNWSVVANKFFDITDPTSLDPILYPPAGDIIAAEYFFNEDPGPGNGNAISIFSPSSSVEVLSSVDVSGLSVGFHQIGVRMKDENGNWSVSEYYDFNIVESIDPISDTLIYPIVEVEYFIGDSDPGVGNGTKLAVSPGHVVDFSSMIDVSNLPIGEYKIAVRSKDLAGNWSVIQSHDFEVVATDDCDVPTVDFTFNAAQAGEVVNFVSTSQHVSEHSVYSWDIFVNGTIDYSGNTATHSFLENGSYLVKLTVDNGGNCKSSSIQSVLIGDQLSTDLTRVGEPVICSGETITLIAPDGSDYLWNTGEETQSISVNSTGLYTAFYKDLNGEFSVSSSEYIVVNPTPTVILSVNHATNGNSNGNASVAVSGGSALTYDFLWSTIENNTMSSVNGLSPGPYTVHVDDGYCPQLIAFEIENKVIDPKGIIRAEYFFNNDDPGPGNALPISVPNGDSITTFSQLDLSGLTPGNHTVSVRIKEEDGDWSVTQSAQFFVMDEIIPLPAQPKGVLVEAEYFIDEDPGPGNAIPIADVIAGENLNVSTSIILDPAILPGNHLLCVRVKDEYGDWSVIEQRDFYVYEEIEPLPELPLFPIVSAEYFIGEEDPGIGNGTPIAISVGVELDEIKTIDVSHLPAGAHLISVRVKDLAGNWSVINSRYFNIENVTCPVPVPLFIPESASINEVTTFTSLSTNVDEFTTYSWDFDVNSVVDYSGQSVQHTFTHEGTYNVMLTVDNGAECVVSVVQQVSVGNVENLIQPSGSIKVCDYEPLVLTAPQGSNYLWNTGSTEASLSVTSSGVYAVTYVNVFGEQVVSEPVDVEFLPGIQVVPVVSNATNGLENGSIWLEVSGGSNSNYSYSWSNGSTATSLNGLAPSSYEVTVDDGVCPITIPFDILDDNFVVTDELVQAEYFFNDSDPGPGNAQPIVIPQGNSIQASYIADLTGLPPGQNYIHIRFRDAIGNWSVIQSATFYVTDSLIARPVPPLTDIVRAEYFFNSIDPGPGNGIALPVSSPAVEYIDTYELDLSSLSSGDHTVHVRVMESDGNWSVTQTRSFNICNVPQAAEVGEDIVVCSGEAIQLTASSVSDINYLWVGPNGYTSSDQNPVIPAALAAQSGNYLLYTENPLEPGCFSLPDTLKVVVNEPLLSAGPIQGNSVVCFDDPIKNYFISPVAGAISYNWSFPTGIDILAGNGTNSIAVDFSNVTVETGQITLSVTNSCNTVVSSPLLFDNQIAPVPVFISPADTVVFCEGNEITLQANSGPNYNYQWFFNEELIPNANSISYVATNEGDYEVEISLPNQCSNKASVYMKKNEENYFFRTKEVLLCLGDSYFAQGDFQTTAGTYRDTIVMNNACDSIIITQVSINEITPTFSSVSPICKGTTLNNLPLVSNNGITGSWSPALNNQATTTYLFTPDAGQCARTTSLTIQVNDEVTPLFNAVQPICSGASLSPLPTVSTNGISGSWSPNLNTTSTTQYTFTPQANECATTTQLTIEVIPNETPQFESIDPVCAGTTLSSLPQTSLNGIVGSWSPAINNQETTTYTFVPNSNQCAVNTELTIEIIQNDLPLFEAVDPVCEGATMTPLPTVSINGITGTWSPSLDNSTTTTYEFIPEAGVCALTASKTITVIPKETPLFTPVEAICAGAELSPLPVVSENGIEGVWEPELNNNVTTEYVFNPVEGACANNYLLTIEVVPNVTPEFELMEEVCQGVEVEHLPSVALNDITGTWSPSEINTQETTTYIFVPEEGICAFDTSLTIEVIPRLTPSFDPIGPLCEGQDVDALPITSLEGIVGTWNQPINAIESADYTFTPTDEWCARDTTIKVIVKENVLPTFELPDFICYGNQDVHLINESNEGIQGVWTPEEINNTETTTYLFEPNENECALAFEQSIEVLALPVVIIEELEGVLFATEGFEQYQWYLDGNQISGANTEVFFPTQNGTYHVQVIDSNGCEGESLAYDLDILAAEVVTFTSFELFPNPSSTSITVRFSESKKRLIKIVDNIGREVMTTHILEENFKFDVHHYASGTYQFIVVEEDTINRKSFVVIAK